MTTLSSVAWVIALLVVVGIAIVATVAMRRRTPTNVEAEPTPAVPSPKPRPVEQPMSGLESALAGVTDSDGRPIGERIDAGAQHVDDLRVPDDTGPVLRRALDHVERDDEASTASADRSAPVDGTGKQQH